MFHSKFYLFLFLAALGLPAHAQHTISVTLSTVGELVRTQNPELAAARLRIQEAASRAKQSGRLANPNFETAFENNPSFRERKIELGFSQRFPITNRLSLEKKLSAIEVQSAEAEVREIERQMTTEAREITVKLLATRQRQNLLRTQTTLMERFASTLAGSAQKGEASPLDASQAKLNTASLEIQIRQLDVEKNAYISNLKTLLGMLPGEVLQVSGMLPESKITSLSAHSTKRHDLQKAELALQAASQGIALEQSRRYDDIEGGLFASSDRSEDAPIGYDTETMIGLRLKIPLPLWNQNKDSVEEAKIRKTRMEHEVAALARKINLDAEAAVADMKQWASLAREIKNNLLPLAVQQVQNAEAAYRSGQGEIQILLQSQDKHLELATSYINAMTEFHLAHIRHDSAFAKP
jgi:outer membrane protein TolC